MRLGRFAEALARLRTAVELRPDLVEPHRLTCACLRELGQLDAAVDACRSARVLAPRTPQVALDLANTLHLAGRHREAVAALRDAVAGDEGGFALRLRLAWFLSTSPDPGVRDGPEAIRLIAATAQRAPTPRVLDVLAAAQAESGSFERAAETAARGAQLADDGGNRDLAEQLRARAADYRAGRPLRYGD